MNLNFLPPIICSAINKTDLDKLYELRLRTGFPIYLNIDNKKYFLGTNGATFLINEGIVCLDEHINYIIRTVCENSIYAFNDSICKGFITTKEGIRIGLAGECVFERDKIITIKNFSSLNIRIPHEIYGCANSIFPVISDNEIIYNTLIISPPFCGKTTILKDLSRMLNETYDKSILIIDKRGEFNKINGQNIDKISFSNKEYAFNYGLRSMSPSVIITDEISSIEDWKFVKLASNSGVKIIASVHASSINDVLRKDYFINNVFERYVLLRSNCQPGVIDKIFNKDLVII